AIEFEKRQDENGIRRDFQNLDALATDLHDWMTSVYPAINPARWRQLDNYDGTDKGDLLSEIRKLKRRSAERDLEGLRKKYRENKLHLVRHQTVAHKSELLHYNQDLMLGTLLPQYRTHLAELAKE